MAACMHERVDCRHERVDCQHEHVDCRHEHVDGRHEHVYGRHERVIASHIKNAHAFYAYLEVRRTLRYVDINKYIEKSCQLND